MKRIVLLAMAAAMMCGCEKEIVSEKPAEDAAGVVATDAAKTKKFTFTMKGDFTSEWKPVTRANE